MAQYKGAASEAGRAMQLMKKREKEREQLEQLKQKIAEVRLHQTLNIIVCSFSCALSTTHFKRSCDLMNKN